MKKMKTISLVLLVAVVVFGGIHIVNIESANARPGCPVENMCPSWSYCKSCWCSSDGFTSTWICECQKASDLDHFFQVAEIVPECDEGPCYYDCPEPPGDD